MEPSVESSRKLVMLICTGLGRVNRGFEQYIGSLAGKLADTGKRVMVASGGSWPQPVNVESIVLRTPHRDSRFLRGSKSAFIREQQFFALALVPSLLKYKPSVVYLGEYRLYCYLYKLRSLLGLNFSLCLYTGGQAIPGAKVFDASRDYVHHITPAYLPQCGNLPAYKQVVLPHFIHDDFVTDPDKETWLRQKAGQKKIVLSVGLLDTRVKQMHFIAEALGSEPEKWFPILLGAPCEETPMLKAIFTEKFGADGFLMEAVPHPALSAYYRTAHVFVSCSPRESFGLAMVEALYHGLPVVAHDFFETKWVLENQATLVDVTNVPLLLKSIGKVVMNDDSERREKRINFAHSRYGWAALCNSYHSFFLAMTQQINVQIPAEANRGGIL